MIIQFLNPLSFTVLGIISCNSGKGRKTGIIYARVSSKAQAEEGHSLESMVDKLTKMAGEQEIDLPYEPILDVASTSKHVSKNLRKILKLAEEGKITHVLVISLDRIGRNPVESLYFVYTLRELGVKVVTLNGEIDVNDIEDLCKAAIECLFAGLEIRNLVERTQRGKERSFQNKNWNKPIPIGYVKDGNWIKKKPEYEPVVREAHILFQQGKKYSEICRYINEKYKNILNKPVDSNRLKRVLTDPVYVGRPRYRDAVVEDPNLKFIDDELFSKTQAILGEMSKKREKKKERKVDLEDLTKIFGLNYAERVLPVAVLCKNCNTPMIKNGTKPVRGVYVNNYLCPKCKRQQTVPTAHQLNHFKSAKPFYCPNCGTPDEFEERGERGRFEITCKVCGYVFETNRSVNKFLRTVKKKREVRRIVSNENQSTLVDFER